MANMINEICADTELDYQYAELSCRIKTLDSTTSVLDAAQKGVDAVKSLYDTGYNLDVGGDAITPDGYFNIAASTKGIEHIVSYSAEIPIANVQNVVSALQSKGYVCEQNRPEPRSTIYLCSAKSKDMPTVNVFHLSYMTRPFISIEGDMPIDDIDRIPKILEELRHMVIKNNRNIHT